MYSVYIRNRHVVLSLLTALYLFSLLLFSSPLPGAVNLPGKRLVPARGKGAGPVTIRDKGWIVSAEKEGGSRVKAEELPGELVVRFKTGIVLDIRRSPSGTLMTGIDSVDLLNVRMRAHSAKKLFPRLKRSSKSGGLPTTYLIRYSSSMTAREAAALYAKDPHVEWAEPNYKAEAWMTPDDPYFSTTGSWGQGYRDMWGLMKVRSEEAWDITTGDSNVVVAVVDTGIDYDHPDLSANVWMNEAERDGEEGVDDDGNGYVDDVYGWDFHNEDADPLDDNGHGTHCAGTIAAMGNNGIGVVGVAWTSRVMGVKALSASGTGASASLAQAVVYAADNGARVLSLSWGLRAHPQVIRDAVEYAHEAGCIVVAAAGNDGEDVVDYSPAGENRVIAVASTDRYDERSTFSNTGAGIDVAAPGGDSGDMYSTPTGQHYYVNILSLRADDTDMYLGAPNYTPGEFVVGDYYYRSRGTSMACPHVAGLAALILSVHPSFLNEQVRQSLHPGRDQSWEDRWDSKLGFGRIDAYESLGVAGPSVALVTSPEPGDVLSGASPIEGSASGPGFQSYSLALYIEDQWVDLYEATVPVESGLLGTIDTTLADDGAHSLRLLVQNSDGSEDAYCTTVETENFEITHPEDWHCLVHGETVSIEGSVPATDLDHYTLEWSPYTLTSWSTDGITLEDGGLVPVEDGVLGTWDTGVVSDPDRYKIRLTVYRTGGCSFTITVEPVVASGFREGWPKETGSYFHTFEYGYICSVIYAGPSIDDVDGSTGAEIFFEGRSTDVPLIHGWDADGGVLQGWPKLLDVGGVSIALSDLDGDGLKEIVQNAWEEDINIFEHDGSIFPEWASSSVRFGGPSIADVDRDGEVEIVGHVQTGEAPDYHYWIGVWEKTGDPLAGWPQEVTSLSRHPAAIGDIDMDGDLEIVATSEESIFAWHHDGQSVAGWPLSLADDIFEGPPVLADLDCDGTLEVIAVTFYGTVRAWSHDGSDFWEGDVSSITLSPPAVGDLNGDGYPEVVVTSYNYTIHAFQPSVGGGELPGWPVYYYSFTGMRSAPAIADVNGDGEQEVILVFPEVPECYLISLVAIDSGGNFLDGWHKLMGGFTGMYDTTPAVLDHDGDGLLEVSCIDHSSIYMWDLENAAGGTVAEWPHYQHDAAHRGQYIPRGLSRGTLYPTGGAVLDPFTFSVTYREEGSSQPSSGVAIIDGFSYPMQGEEQELTGEKVFHISIALPSGSHNYHFEFAEDQDQAYRFPPSGELAGPVVTMTDSDGDGLPDEWELYHFGGLDPEPGDDPDGDGLNNLIESQYLTDPMTPDTDGDGMPDGWEVQFAPSLNPRVDDAAGDADSDGLTNLFEYSIGTDPTDTDTDGDGIGDYDEVYYNGDPDYDPYDPNTGEGTDLNATDADTDGDGYTDHVEIVFGTDPLDPDSIPGTVRINFQPFSADIPAGYLRDWGDGYGEGRGYGWM